MRYVMTLATLLIAGCTHIDTGEIQYRIADSPKIKTEVKLTSEASSTDPLLPAPVYRKYLPAGDEYGKPFVAKEVYSIDLEQVVIGENILEGQILGQQFGSKGEFAILANVFEFAAQESDAAKKRFLEAAEYSRKPGTNDVELKLIYYGDDIRRKQALNFDGMTIKPRDVYLGGSIGIQFVIMELDIKPGPITSLLTTLAESGKSLIPGPPELGNLLTDLGGSLFKGGNTDDRLFDYRMVLSTAGVDPREPKGVFAPGRYVFRRAQVRGKPMIWSDLELDHNTGRLYRLVKSNGAKDGAGNTGEGAVTKVEIRDELYLVVNIRRHPEGTPTEYYMQSGLNTFREALQKAADDEAATLDKVTDDIKKMVIERRSSNWGMRLARKWATAEGLLRNYTLLEMPDPVFDAKTCPAGVDLLRRRDLAKRATRDALLAFLAEYDLALRKVGDPAASEFDIADQNALVSSVARYFMPWANAETESQFNDGATFDTAFIGGDATGNLIDRAMEVASGRAKKVSCANLQAAG